MPRIPQLIFPIFFIILAQGCSILNPYDSESMCAGIEDYGSCVTAQEAYKEAVTGEKARVTRPQYNDLSDTTPEAKTGSYNKNALGEYQSSYYKRLKKLIEKPVAPLIKQPKVIRGLILPYGKKTLFTARYVYIMVEDPTFILGDYLSTPKSQNNSSLINPMDR